MKGTFEIGDVVDDPTETRIVNAVSDVFGAHRARGIAILSGPCPCGGTHPRIVVLVGFRWWHAFAFARRYEKMHQAAFEAAGGGPAAVEVKRMGRALLRDGERAQKVFLAREAQS